MIKPLMEKIYLLREDKLELGIDIEINDRFKLNRADSFIKNNFTVKEIEYAYTKKNPEMYLCGFFCAKEAIVKTINHPILFKYIEILHNNRGKPLVSIRNKSIKDYQFLISISHCKCHSVAAVLRL